MKNKLALCFRPVVFESEETDHNDVNHAVSTSVIVAKEHSKSKPSFLETGNNLQVHRHHPHKNSSRKTLSRAFRAILFQTQPRLRVREGDIRRLTFVPKGNDLEGESTMTTKRGEVKSQENKMISSASSSSFSSTTTSTTESVSSSLSASHDLKSHTLKRTLMARSRSNSFDQKKKPKTSQIISDNIAMKSSSSQDDLVFYLIVLALFSTIIWGTFYAILFTSMLLYFVPILSGFYQRPENTVKLPEMEKSKRHKKRVIMEGLLERKQPTQRALNF